MELLQASTPAVSLQREESRRIYEESCDVIPLGVNSPVRAFPGLNQTPLVVDSGYGDLLVDVDHNQFVDYCCSWGALIHGHAHPRVVEAAQKRVAMGSSFGAATESECRLAEKVVELIPAIEKVRLVSSGTEATMSAVRLARGYTGRDLIVKFTGNYHGHADGFLVQAGSGAMHLSSSSSAGVPEEVAKQTICLPYNDLEACYALFTDREIIDDLAAVILEPVAANMGVVHPVPGFLELLREETSKCGALLIFDEVITGFRVARGGASELFGIIPDLICLGKIVGGGFPAAAFGGRSDIMDYLAPQGPVYQAGTLSGNPVAMEAGFATLSLLERPTFYEELEEKTELIVEPVKEALAKKGVKGCVQHVGSLFTLFFGATEIQNVEAAKAELDLSLFNAYFRYMFQQGIYVPPSQYEACFVSAAHTHAHLIQTRDAILEFLDQVF